MTLVFARKFDDMIFCIADTSSFTPALQTSQNPILHPLIKIRPLTQSLTLAYAGSTHFVNQLRIWSDTSLSDVQIEQDCLETARRAAGQVDFLLINQEAWSITAITADGVSLCDAKMLGDSAAKELYSRERASISDAEITEFLGVLLPDGCSDVSHRKYGSDLHAFLSTLDHNLPYCRGLAIPFVVTKSTKSFEGFSRVVRGPLEVGEVGPTPMPIQFADAYHGQTTFSLCGGTDWLAFHFFELGLGVVIHVGLPQVSATAFRGIHQDDFIRKGKDFIGCDFPLGRFS